MTVETTNTPEPHQSLKIVVGATDDATGEEAWLQGAAIARAAPRAEVHLCRCVGDAEGDVAQKLADGERALGQWALARLAGDAMIQRAEIHVGVGEPAEVLRQLAVDLEADMIVVGTHNKGVLERLVRGSVVYELLADAPCTVTVAMPADYSGRDRSPEIEAAHPLAVEGRTLTGTHVYTYRRSVRVNAPQSSFWLENSP